MYGYLSVHEGALVCADNKDVIVYTDRLRRIAHSRRVVYVACGLIVDEDKVLFELGDGLEPVVRLKRPASAIHREGRTAYVADRFGDVLRIDLCAKQATLVMGSMCYNTSMCVYGGLVVTSDKYGRIRVSRPCGRIEAYLFNEEGPVVSMVKCRCLVVAFRGVVKLFDEAFLVQGTIPFKDGGVRKLVRIDETSFFVLGDRTWRVCGGEVVESYPRADDAAWIGGRAAFISDGRLVVGDGDLCRLSGDYDDFMAKISADCPRERPGCTRSVQTRQE